MRRNQKRRLPEDELDGTRVMQYLVLLPVCLGWLAAAGKLATDTPSPTDPAIPKPRDTSTFYQNIGDEEGFSYVPTLDAEFIVDLQEQDEIVNEPVWNTDGDLQNGDQLYPDYDEFRRRLAFNIGGDFPNEDELHYTGSRVDAADIENFLIIENKRKRQEANELYRAKENPSITLVCNEPVNIPTSDVPKKVKTIRMIPLVKNIERIAMPALDPETLCQDLANPIRSNIKATTVAEWFTGPGQEHNCDSFPWNPRKMIAESGDEIIPLPSLAVSGSWQRQWHNVFIGMVWGSETNAQENTGSSSTSNNADTQAQGQSNTVQETVASGPSDQTRANVPLREVVNSLENSNLPNPQPFMSYEWHRLASFKDFPKRDKPYLTRLAAAGFYFTGTQAKCYVCEKIYDSLSAADMPLRVHEQLSPNCAFLRNNEAVNIPISGPQYAPVHANRRQRLDAPTGSGEEVGQQELALPAGRPETERIGQGAVEPNGQHGRSGGQQSHNDHINCVRPRHPSYVDQRARRNSFATWPAGMRQQPGEMADAGFFYCGDGDCVRCFFCDLGLRLWAEEDDPWFEHCRWSPGCDYLTTVKGEEFVRLVQEALSYEQEPEDTERRLGVPNTTGTTGDTGMPDSLSNQGSAAATGGLADVDLEEAPPQTTVDTEYASAKAENDRLKRSMQCKVCLDKPLSIVFLPCGHLVTCEDCAKIVRKCPICRQRVNGTVKTYMK